MALEYDQEKGSFRHSVERLQESEHISLLEGNIESYWVGSSTAHGSAGCRCLSHIPEVHLQLAASREFHCVWLGALSEHEVCLAIGYTVS